MKPTPLFLTTLFSCLAYSQKEDYREIDREWATKIKAVFENLDFSKVPHGILLDYEMEFTDVTAYNGTLTDSTAINSPVFSEPQGSTNFSPIVNITIFNQSVVPALSFPNTQLQATLDISALPTGSYIVKIGNSPWQTKNHTIIKL